jgi:predicted nucleotidyltransferase
VHTHPNSTPEERREILEFYPRGCAGHPTAHRGLIAEFLADGRSVLFCVKIETMKPSEALAIHGAKLRQLARRHGLSHPRVFGSVLRGTDAEQSDLDRLVDPAESTSLLTLAAFKIDAEALLGVPVSVLTPNALPPKFRRTVLGQARAL